MDNNLYTDILQICRTCMQEIIDTSFFYLDCAPLANTQLTIRQTLYNCIPELDLSIVQNAVICSKCVDNLLSALKLKKNCLESEMQINKYIQQVQHTGDLNLNLVEVVQFHQAGIKNLDIEVKLEDPEITDNFKNEDLVCDTNAFNEASECIESAESKYPLKLETVDTQYVLFNTFDDHNVNYNLSAAEENSDIHNSSIAQNCLPDVFELQDHTYSKNLNIQVNKTNLIGNEKKLIKTCNNYKNRSKSKKPKQHLSHGNSLKPNMKAHMLEKLFKCSICEYQCNYKRNLKRHMLIHTQEKPFLCSVCGNFKSNIKEHMRSHTGEKPFSCAICEFQCSQKCHLKQHILIHTGEKPFSCSVCKYQCSYKSYLKKHMQLHTGVKPFSCSFCKYQCSNKSYLKSHIMLIHTGEKPFSCSVCEYQCSLKCNLKQHMRIHTREKPFSCSVCKYQCSQKSDLRKHMLSHTGDKPFSCSVCEYQCSTNSNLNRHMRIHTGKKPFSCSVCEYQCSQKSYLKQHILIHTGEKPFSCSICKYQCNKRCNLKKHYMRIHT